ncbi:Golgi pH regulator [Purpureocillium lavendulum]|uniref:Golgi pH regulator n=1 Tax=Purpureocillium lavendulum TaxID=1247861 RepID=A0AB34FTC6_9HYPO|nr:Golgi pH regulator [Purpureocillium lavendulum]
MGSLPQTPPAYDVLIVGAGLSGLCSLYHLIRRCPEWRVLVIDSAPEVGGTWYWNCYPGCRFDSESVSYGFSFDKELLQEWDWKETFSAQPDTLEYIQYFARKHHLYEYIQFNTEIKAARWSEESRMWTLVDIKGNEYAARFFISCLGVFSAPTLPAVAGIETFRGQLFHTSRWPRETDIAHDFAGKLIGVIGTGATGIQTITAISKEPGIKSLSVFQRTANWSVPLRNEPISPGQMQVLKKSYEDVFQRCADTTSSFIHKPDPRNSCEVTQDERLALWEKLYSEPGFGKWLGVFSDTYTDRNANDLYSDFIANKIRHRVDDPTVAESLIPKNHGFGTRRVPLESGYFEAYNKPHVHLVDLQKTPIKHVTATGIVTSDGREHPLDILVCATGFDAITGAFNNINWSGKEDRPLIATSDSPEVDRAAWPDHQPSTFLGLAVSAMPNLFMVLGPHQQFGNIPRSIEYAAKTVVDLLGYCNDKGFTYVEATPKAVNEWTSHVVECDRGQPLTNKVDSWMTGVNTNVKGKTSRSVARYSGGAIEYRKRCEEVKKADYEGFILA